MQDLYKNNENFFFFFIMKTRNKGGLQQIAQNDSSDTDFKDSIGIYKKMHH